MNKAHARMLLDLSGVIRRAGDIDADILRRVSAELTECYNTIEAEANVGPILAAAGLMPVDATPATAVRALLAMRDDWKRERESLTFNLRAGLGAVREQRVAIDAAESTIRHLRSDVDDAKREIRRITDAFIATDDLGVPGSEFKRCLLCGGESSPGGAPLRHRSTCPLVDDRDGVDGGEFEERQLERREA